MGIRVLSDQLKYRLVLGPSGFQLIGLHTIQFTSSSSYISYRLAVAHLLCTRNSTDWLPPVALRRVLVSRLAAARRPKTDFA